jgi:hypothetical protein
MILRKRKERAGVKVQSLKQLRETRGRDKTDKIHVERYGCAQNGILDRHAVIDHTSENGCWKSEQTEKEDHTGGRREIPCAPRMVFLLLVALL